MHGIYAYTGPASAGSFVSGLRSSEERMFLAGLALHAAGEVRQPAFDQQQLLLGQRGGQLLLQPGDPGLGLGQQRGARRAQAELLDAAML